MGARPRRKDGRRPSERGSIGKGLRLALVVSRFNRSVTGKLLGGALGVLRKNGIGKKGIDVIRVPGAFEIPLAAKRLALTGDFDGLICLGAVIRGETPHFEYISSAASYGLAQVMLETGIPVGFGVLTTDTVQQALARADARRSNRGGQAAETVLEMIRILRKIS